MLQIWRAIENKIIGNISYKIIQNLNIQNEHLSIEDGGYKIRNYGR